MDIAIIGAGRVGSALARAFSRTGHQVTLGVRDPGKAEIRAIAEETGARTMLPAEAAATAPVIVLALPWGVAEAAVRALGDLSGKIVIDAMNPIAMTVSGPALDRGFSTSGAETVAGWCPAARIVKTLNQVGAEMMADNAALPHRPVMFMAGDDAAAKAVVAGLLTDIGFDAKDSGDLTKARILEPFAFAWINQAIFRGEGRDWAFAAVKTNRTAR